MLGTSTLAENPEQTGLVWVSYCFRLSHFLRLLPDTSAPTWLAFTWGSSCRWVGIPNGCGVCSLPHKNWGTSMRSTRSWLIGPGWLPRRTLRWVLAKQEISWAVHVVTDWEFHRGSSLIFVGMKLSHWLTQVNSATRCMDNASINYILWLGWYLMVGRNSSQLLMEGSLGCKQKPFSKLPRE